MSKIKTGSKHPKKKRDRLKKTDRRQRILLELKLSPHVRISDLARNFDVSTETVRRDFDALAKDGLIARAHGGASAPVQGHYPSLDERTEARINERERIGSKAAESVREGETVLIDSGSTTLQMARALAFRETRCTVVTNSIPVAMTLGHGASEVILCPGKYLAAESALVGPDTLEFLSRINADKCVIGASGLADEGPSEPIHDVAAVKRAMLCRSAERQLLVDSNKFNRSSQFRFADLVNLDTIYVDSPPTENLKQALDAAKVEIIVAFPIEEKIGGLLP
ncbi:MAG: DeoR/GlpR family DNA-binding transcription regulator [Ruegeria sp.]